MNLHKSINLLDGVFGEIQGNHKMCCHDYLIQPNFFQLNPGVRAILFILPEAKVEPRLRVI